MTKRRVRFRNGARITCSLTRQKDVRLVIASGVLRHEKRKKKGTSNGRERGNDGDGKGIEK
jgi:hypothetical protein